ncbi:hypothetical protein Trydic_g9430 [Trypoxylus dichotomus]
MARKMRDTPSTLTDYYKWRRDGGPSVPRFPVVPSWPHHSGASGNELLNYTNGCHRRELINFHERDHTAPLALFTPPQLVKL